MSAAMEFALPKWENRLTVSALMTPPDSLGVPALAGFATA
jgi:hypothetical protein